MSTRVTDAYGRPQGTPLRLVADAAGPPPRAKRSLGQNFLVDRRALAQVVDAAEIAPTDQVLEIGPGRGVLTRRLADLAECVTAVELDDALSARLSAQFADRPNVRIVPGDARTIDVAALLDASSPYKLVANLPYYAATPIVRRFLEMERSPSLMVVMVQREVARSMCAKPGAMSLLSVATQLYGKPRIVASVPPRAFRPAPRVTSAIVRIDVYDNAALDLRSRGDFFGLVRAGFSARRKQLRNALRQGLSLPTADVEDLLARAGIDPTRRAETLSLAEWGDLHSAHIPDCRHAE